MAAADTGSFTYQDGWGQIYEISWETIPSDLGDLIDMTTIIKEPRVWGEAEQGYIENRVVHKRGICTTIRTVIGEGSDGYLILAEGSSQVVCTFVATFQCAGKPVDLFLYHLDSDVCGDTEFIIDCGPRWADPDEELDDCVEWLEVDAGGTPIPDLDVQPFEWVDVWANDEVLTSNCDPTCATT